MPKFRQRWDQYMFSVAKNASPSAKRQYWQLLVPVGFKSFPVLRGLWRKGPRYCWHDCPNNQINSHWRDEPLGGCMMLNSSGVQVTSIPCNAFETVALTIYWIGDTQYLKIRLTKYKSNTSSARIQSNLLKAGTHQQKSMSKRTSTM